MTIATKSGGLIVKDGRLAQNCGCCVAPICGCNDESKIPVSVVAEFRDFVFSFEFGNAIGTASQIQDFTNSMTPTLQRRSPLTIASSGVEYSTGGCTATPCVGCSPPFTSRAAYGPGALRDSLTIGLPCEGGAVFPTGSFIGFTRSQLIFFSPSGCPPTGAPSGTVVVVSVELPISISDPSFCNIANGTVTELSLPIVLSNPTFTRNTRAEWRFGTQIGYYRATAGTITVKFNALP